MAQKKMLMVVNPAAGKGKAKNCLLKLISVFSSAGYTVTVYPTVNDVQTKLYVEKNSSKYDILVCCGGDGTFSETVSGLLKAKDPPKLGYIPMGTTNDVAHTYGISKNPLISARRIIIGEEQTADVGLFNDKPFSYVAAAGAFANVSFNTSSELKSVFGHLAYVLEGIKDVPNIKPKRIRLEFDGNVVEDDLIYVSFSNSSKIGGVFELPHVKTNDGIFEPTLVKAPNDIKDTAEIVKHVIKKDLENCAIKVYRATSVKIICDEELQWSLDGENGGRCKEAFISNISNAIKLIL